MKKLHLAQGFLAGAPETEWVWKAILKLNDARVKVAHTLDKEEVAQKLEAFMKFVESVDGPPPADAFNGPMQRFQLSSFKVFMHTLHAVQIDPSDVKIKIILGNGG